jgi:hypothetical protein
MSIAQSAAELLKKHITLEVEGIDRMYLNVYIPRLQCERGVVWFFRHHRGQPFASSALMAPISKAFVAAIESFVKRRGIPMVEFRKGQRKDDIAAGYLTAFGNREGVVFVGKAQEKTPVFRTEKRRNPRTGGSYGWIVRSSAMVNHYYFYCVDRDFGPFFLKFCSYFPYTAKLCLNGHEYVKRQLEREGIDYEALDNGIRSCAHARRLQALCDGLSAEKIDALLRKWLHLLPHPFPKRDRQAGYRYELSILQAEFSLTQVWEQPVHGRLFFEQVIRENLDLGRPDQVSLIFARRVKRSTPGRFRTRVITEGVLPSLHIDYKSSRIKQYFKEGRALRTETTINNTRDFRVGKRLCNLPALRQIGFQANRRLLDVQRLSHDPALGEELLERLHRPVTVERQRASALRFTDARVRALYHALIVFRLLPYGFTQRDLRQHSAQLTALSPEQITAGRMSYDLRRLRLHGMIQRIPQTHRYEVTSLGWRAALFLTRLHARLLQPGCSELMPSTPLLPSTLRHCFERLDEEINQRINEAKLAA